MTPPKAPSIRMSNRDIGNAWTAAIFGELFEEWPRRQDFNAMDLATATGTPSYSDREEVFDDLILWLVQENYITVGQSVEGNAYNVALTGKGYAVLGSMPESLTEPLGRRLKGVAQGAASEVGRQIIASAVAMVFATAAG